LTEFEAYAIKYHNISPSTDEELEERIATENFETYQQKQLDKQDMVPVQPVKVCLTNCNSPVAYHLAQLVASGAVLGPTQKVAIHLYHSQHTPACDGLVMELLDLASPLLEYTHFTSSLLEAFDDVTLVYILDYPYCVRNLLLASSKCRSVEFTNAVAMFQKYTSALDFAASKDVKVVVSGCFANTGAGLMSLCASSLPPSCFVAAPCLAESQAKVVLANRLQLNSDEIQQLAIWGRTHGTILVDHSSTRVSHYPGAIVGPDPFNLHLKECEFDSDWLENEFPQLVSARHNLLDGYKEEGPCLAEAVGLAKLGCYWSLGDTSTWQSVGIVSNEKFQEVPSHVACSVPCRCKDGKWEPVPDVDPPGHIKVNCLSL
jgi:malate/lactate dehydrogenase